jgi:hypothetical protein
MITRSEILADQYTITKQQLIELYGIARCIAMELRIGGEAEQEILNLIDKIKDREGD